MVITVMSGCANYCYESVGITATLQTKYSDVLSKIYLSQTAYQLVYCWHCKSYYTYVILLWIFIKSDSLFWIGSRVVKLAWLLSFECMLWVSGWRVGGICRLVFSWRVYWLFLINGLVCNFSHNREKCHRIFNRPRVIGLFKPQFWYTTKKGHGWINLLGGLVAKMTCWAPHNSHVSPTLCVQWAQVCLISNFLSFHGMWKICAPN